MTKGRELFALEWVKGEILGTLGNARQSLEAYAELGRDETRLRACLTGLHQVHGSLVMLELSGIAVLADHLERLAQALLNGSFANDEAACQLLMQGILELPVRLERIQEGNPDAEANVLGLVNPIRTLLGLALLDVPRPVQFEAGEAALDRFERIDGAGKIRRIRAAYQGVLLKLLKGERPPEFIDTLKKVGTGLERICQGTPSELLWQCFGEFVDSLSGQSGPVLGDALKALRRVDVEIRRFGQEGVEAILAPVPEKLLELLLSMAGSDGRHSEQLEHLRARIQPVDRGELIASGREALMAASYALVDELAVVKDQIDLLVRAETRTPEPLVAMRPVLERLAATCSLLGFESSRVLILQQLEVIDQAAAGTAITREFLFGIAAALLQVEENFKAISASGIADSGQEGVSNAARQVLSQTRTELESIKQAVVGFVGNGFDATFLDGVPTKLHDIASVLAMVGFARPSTLLEDCRAFLVLEIAGYKQSDAASQWERLDRFADCLSGVDYHLERIENQVGGRADDVLDIVERNLIAAGYFGLGIQTPVDPVPAAASLTDQAVANSAQPELIDETSDERSQLVAIAEQENAPRFPIDAEPLVLEAREPAAEVNEDDAVAPVAVALESDKASNDAEPVVDTTSQELRASNDFEVDALAVSEVVPTSLEVSFDAQEAGARDLEAEPTPDLTPQPSLVQPPSMVVAEPEPAPSEAVAEIELRDWLAQPFEGVPSEVVVSNTADVDFAATPEHTPSELESTEEENATAFIEPETAFDVGLITSASTTEWTEEVEPGSGMSDESTDFVAAATEIAAASETSSVGVLDRSESFILTELPVDTATVESLPPTVASEPIAELHDQPPSIDAASQGKMLDAQVVKLDMPVATQSAHSASSISALEFDLSDARFDVLELTATAGEASSDDDFDEEIRGVFLEEASEVLASLEGLLKAWRSDTTSSETLREIRRGFHTLKGSGRVAGAVLLGELAWAVENMLNRVLDGTILVTTDFVRVADDSIRLMPELLTSFRTRAALKSERAIGLLIEMADVLASGGSIGSEEEAGELHEPTTEVSEEFQLFTGELRDNLLLLRNKTGRRRVQIDDELLMALHTTTGSAGLVGEIEIARLFELLYDVARNNQAETLRGPNVEVDVARLFQDVADALDPIVPHMGHDQQLETAGSAKIVDALADRADEILSRVDESPSEEGLLGLSELDVVINARSTILDWGRGRIDNGFHQDFAAAMQAIVGATFRPQITDIAKLLQAAMRTFEGAQMLPPLAQSALIEGCDRILQVVDAIATDRVLPRVDDVVTRLNDLVTGPLPAEQFNSVVVALPERVEAQANQIPTPLNVVAAVPTPVSKLTWSPADSRVLAQLQREAEQMDPDLADVFFEESEEILEGMDGTVQAFCHDAENLLHLENILRGLHTLKGSSRLAGLALFGDRVHHFESLLAALQLGEGVIDGPVRQEAQARFDEVVHLAQVAREAFRNKDQKGDHTSITSQTGVARSAVPIGLRSTAQDAPLPERDSRASDSMPAQVSAESGPEMVRVRANLLENLVNLAGESSILRARVEQGINDFTAALDEMEITIERVSEQLRRMEIETDSQAIYRVERPDRRDTQFDPLEMDRYSQLQQLTRALSESSSDMRDLKDTLLLRSREAETILLQQARVNTELQEGLMRTRMVPFNRLLPRLNRIVRQVAAELGKDVEFHVFNAEGELDRNLLERMVPPLEHMLRNAVDHGIETNNVRRSFGKQVPGRIDLRVSREGGDIVIEIGDDGMGIDVESVRAKAMERGLMRSDAILADEEVLEFVLAPGFSTAKSITQISGRGVGLDVVNSEVKQLGGSVSIFSTAGKGTRFVLRVPFTVSVNRALMVTVGDDQYAIPLNTIEGIVLVDAATLKSIYASENKLFEYASLTYRVRYLGRYLGRGEPAASQRGGIPLVLVRAGEQSVAIAVDGVQGSREIVVKSLGPQFAGVGGISGATILGDGSVVIILDLVALIRSQGREVLAAVSRDGATVLRPRCVMVVDDSVTVRKVTTRLLERQGMDVIVAKDGVEAMSLLGERTPDVMLLDIEMPRMDGFEVARQVRHDMRTAGLPIIMISSRTGDKHQEHARALGINRFLGKPFQENELLAAIDELAERR